MVKKRWVLAAVGLAVLVILLAAGGFFYKNLSEDPVEAAVLHIERGSVQVDQGKGWTAAVEGMSLGPNDKIRTLDGTATLTLQESIVIDLEPNTEVSVKELSRQRSAVKLEGGSLWSKFTKISGAQQYEVETPNTVATVRGTEFGTDYLNEETLVVVGDGEVQLKGGAEQQVVRRREAFARTKEAFRKVEFTGKHLARVREKARKSLENLRALRTRMVEGFLKRNREIAEQVKQRYGVSEDQLPEAFRRADAGEINEDELIERAPVKLPVMFRLRDLNREIRKQQQRLAELEPAPSG